VFFVHINDYLIQSANSGGRGRYLIVNKKEERILGSQLYALAYEKIKLTHRQIVRHQIFLLVQVGDARLGRLLHNDLFMTF
jgi:hypothetical protein